MSFSKVFQFPICVCSGAHILPAKTLLFCNFFNFYFTFPFGLLKEVPQLKSSDLVAQSTHKPLLMWSAECLKAMSVEQRAQNRLPWTRLCYSTTGDGPISFHHTPTHAVMNRMRVPKPQTKYLGLVLMSVPGSSLIWNAVDWPAEQKSLLIEAWVGLLSN